MNISGAALCPSISDPAGLSGARDCIFNKFPGDADAVGPGPQTESLG